MTRVIEGDLIATTASITIVVARFNELVVDSLLKGALDALKRHGVQDSNITIVKVPGAFELPLAAKKAAEQEGCDAVIVLGAVIRGGTPISIMWQVRRQAALPRLDWIRTSPLFLECSQRTASNKRLNGLALKRATKVQMPQSPRSR